MKQYCTIYGWLPPPVLNGSRQKHWTVLRREAKQAQRTAWGTARQAGWQFIPGRVRLTVTFVFSVRRTRDTDNLYARAKHLVDGLKPFFTDDSSDVLDLHVGAEVVPGTKQTRLSLESITPSEVAS